MWDKLELLHYERQLELIGRRGRHRLKRSGVFIAGAGGLGTAAASYLAAAGIGRILIVRPGQIQVNNLNRQVMYAEKDAGKLKAAALAGRLRGLNPHIEISGERIDISASDIRDGVSTLTSSSMPWTIFVPAMSSTAPPSPRAFRRPRQHPRLLWTGDDPGARPDPLPEVPFSRDSERRHPVRPRACLRRHRLPPGHGGHQVSPGQRLSPDEQAPRF